MISDIHRSKEQLLEHDAQQELQTPVGDVGIRNERLSKTIAEEEHKKMMRKRNNTVDHKRHGEEEHQEDEEQDQQDFKNKLQIFQSESKFDDFEGSQYEGGADVISRPSRP